MRRSSTFGLRRSSSMDPHENTTKKYPNSIKFPTSPQLSSEEMVHFSHPQHHIAKVDLSDPFTCAGCKEFGAGKRFICLQCDFQLHDFCALAPPLLNRHPFHFQHQLAFYPKPVKGGIMKSKCDICGKPTKGYIFKCIPCSFQMHPCCAMLSQEVKFSVHQEHKLKLLNAATTPLLNGETGGLVCGECKRKRSGRVYGCTVCEYHLHAICAKNMVNGVEDNGMKGVDDKASIFGTAAKVASLAVKGFIGGLIEGIGEGVGEVLIQTITRGGPNNPRRRFR